MTQDTVDQLPDAPTFHYEPYVHDGELTGTITGETFGVIVPDPEFVDRWEHDPDVLSVFLDPVDAMHHAYGDAHDDVSGRSLQATADWVDLHSDLAEEVIREIPQYNAFDPDLLIETIDEMPPALFSAGRQMSVGLHFWTLEPAQLGECLQEMVDIESDDVFAGRGPDELSAFLAPETWPDFDEDVESLWSHLDSQVEDTDGQPALIRAWWD